MSNTSLQRKTAASASETAMPATQLKRAYSPPAFSPGAAPLQKKDKTDPETQRHRAFMSMENSEENAATIYEQSHHETYSGVSGFFGYTSKSLSYEKAANNIAQLINYNNAALAESVFDKVPDDETDDVGYYLLTKASNEGLEACPLTFLNKIKREMNDRGMMAEDYDGRDAQLKRLDEIITKYNPLRAQALNLYWKPELSPSEFQTFKEYTLSIPKKQASHRSQYEKKLLEFEFHLLWKKSTLTTAEIKTARTYIDSLSDAKKKTKLFGELQEKVQYVNQRENSAYTGEGQGGGSCNLASLGMSLSFLGLEVPAEYQEVPGQENGYIEQLEYIRRENNHAARTTYGGWGAVATDMGAEHDMILYQKKTTKDWWLNTVKAGHLDKGHAIMVGINGHIVRAQAVTSKGVVTDDPYGKTKLKSGTSRGWDEKNSTTIEANQDSDNDKHQPNEGEDHIWAWDDVIKHKFGWVVALWNKN